MTRACYVLRFALAENPSLRTAYFRLHGRVVVLPTSASLNTIPEFSRLKKKRGIHARSHAATPEIPVTAAGEENIMCQQDDRWGCWRFIVVQVVVCLITKDHFNLQTPMLGLLEALFIWICQNQGFYSK